MLAHIYIDWFVQKPYNSIIAITSDPYKCRLFPKQRLATDFSSALGIPADSCLMALSELQNTAIDKLHARREFADHGLATIKVRAPTQTASGTRLVTVKINLNRLGSDFHQLVAETLNLPRRSIKIINAGKFVVDELTLGQQNICNNQQVMAIVVSGSGGGGTEDEAAAGSSTAVASSESSDNIHAKLAKAREDAEMLTSQQDYSFMEVNFCFYYLTNKKLHFMQNI